MEFCENYRQALTEYAAGLITGSAAEEAVEHARKCGECGEFLQETKKLFNYVRSEPLPEPSAEYVFGLSKKALAELGGEIPGSGTGNRVVRMPARGRFLRAAAALAAVFILGFGFFRIQMQTDKPSVQNQVSASAVKDVVSDIYEEGSGLEVPDSALEMDVDPANLEMGLIPKGGVSGVEDIDSAKEHIAVSPYSNTIGEYIDSMTEEEAREMLEALEKEEIRGS